MLVRIFTGASWATARQLDDCMFDTVPLVGDKLAIGLDNGWDVAVVEDIVHRITDPNEAADIAIRVSDPVTGGSATDPLPLRELDAVGGGAKPATSTASVPRTRGPWGS